MIRDWISFTCNSYISRISRFLGVLNCCQNNPLAFFYMDGVRRILGSLYEDLVSECTFSDLVVVAENHVCEHPHHIWCSYVSISHLFIFGCG